MSPTPFPPTAAQVRDVLGSYRRCTIVAETPKSYRVRLLEPGVFSRRNRLPGETILVAKHRIEFPGERTPTCQETP